MRYTKQYITPEGIEHMRTFQYDGSDPSYLYKYFHSPLANFLVKYVVPSWVAPNVLTLTGFLFTLSAHAIFFYYSGGEMSSDYYPRWAHLYAAVSIFLYSVFDNLDGKQARKTNSSSILGATFDHGVDAINAGIIGITIISGISMQNVKGYYAMAVVVLMPLFTAAWEEYHMKGMFMPIINGPNEGLCAIELGHLLAFFWGEEFWEASAFWGLSRADLLMYWCIFQGQLTSAQNIYRVTFECKSHRSLLERYRGLGVLVFILGCVILVQVCSPTNIAIRKGRWIMYFFLLGWAKVNTLIHLWYATGQELYLFKKSVVIPFAIFTANSVAGYFLGAAPVDEDLLLYTGIPIMLAMYLYFATSIVKHLAEILNIYVFTLKKKERVD